jgi:hypothetical protein
MLLITIPRLRTAPLALAAGALAGALVLGVGGRLLMAIVALLAGGQPSFSLGGSLEVLVVGTGYGVVGGLLLPLLPRTAGAGRWPAPALLGVLLFAVAWLTSSVGRGAATGRLPLIVLLALPAFVLWGFLATALYARWQPQ